MATPGPPPPVDPECALGSNSGPCLEHSYDRGDIRYEAGQKICMSRLLLPGFNMLPRWLLGGAYLLFLLYLFVGIIHVAHHFMGGVATITALTHRKRHWKRNGEVVWIDKPVWNWAVASIVLVAMGTSAPKIMLSLIEALLTLDSTPGALGPSCIVGGAVYNLMVTGASAVVALPYGTCKRIKAFRVYVMSVFWALWSIIWMLIVLRWWTPHVVTIAEASITLSFFFCMTFTAWFVDARPWRHWLWWTRQHWLRPHDGRSAPGTPNLDIMKVIPDDGGENGGGDADGSGGGGGGLNGSSGGGGGKKPRTAWEDPINAALARANAANDGDEASDEQTEKNRVFVDDLIAQRRIGGIKRFHWRPVSPMVVNPDGTVQLAPLDKEQVMFKSPTYSFKRAAGTARVAVIRVPPPSGSLDAPLVVAWKTENGDAIAGMDYTASEGVVTFYPGEDKQHMEVPLLLSESNTEPETSFYIKLIRMDTPEGMRAAVSPDRVKVMLTEEESAGLLGFEMPEYEVVYDQNRPYAEVTVLRRKGSGGHVEAEYVEMDESAIAGKDYVLLSGKIVLEPGQKSTHLRIPLLPGGSGSFGQRRTLLVMLQNPDGGAGLSTRHTTRIAIVKGSNPDLQDKEARAFNLRQAWWDQITDAFMFEMPPAGEPIRWYNLVEHYLGYHWRVMLAMLCPPPDWARGYPCFVASLACILGIVYCINEAGLLFGCIVGLKDVMTGLSLLAMGTSLPVTFTSRIAAMTQPTADTAIGNINASNAVVVYVGLGVPWLICSVYYKVVRGTDYVVPSVDLSYAVVLWGIIAAIAITLGGIGRYRGGELGGGKWWQHFVFALLVSVWLAYLVLSGLRAYGNIPSPFDQQ